MKKLFTVLMAAAAFTSVSAQTSKTLYEDANAPMLSWSVACEVSASQVSGIKAGDQFIVTVNARQEGNEWPKFGFEVGSESIYPEAFEMWGDKSFPLNTTYTVSAADAELLADGFEIKGDGVQITKVVFVQNEPEVLPEGESVIYNNPDAPMLSWSALCNVTASQVSGIKAGDQFIVTVNARQDGNEWPKFGFEVGGESIYPEAFEMWGDKSFPLNTTYTVSAADAELLADGFEIKGDGVQITKVVFVQNEPEVLPEGESVIYNNPDAPMLSWSTLCAVTASQIEGIQAGDQFVVTVNAVQEGNEWPKFGFEVGGESIYPEAFEMWGDKTFPYTAIYYVSAADAELLAGGFEIKGDGVQITKVIFVQNNGEVNSDIVLWSGESTLLTWGAGPTVSAGKASSIEVGNQLVITVDEILLGENNWPKIVCRCEDGWEEIFNIEFDKEEFSVSDFPFEKEITVTSDMMELLQQGFNFGGESVYISQVTLVKNAGETSVKRIDTLELSSISVYTINGVCVRKNVDPSSALQGLPSGLYIVGGKKILVK